MEKTLLASKPGGGYKMGQISFVPSSLKRKPVPSAASSTNVTTYETDLLLSLMK